MDKAVLERTSHTERIVNEDKSTEVKVEFLTSAEKETLAFLQGLKTTVQMQNLLLHLVLIQS